MARTACLMTTAALLVATVMHSGSAAPTVTPAVPARGSDAHHHTAAGALDVAVRGRREQRREKRCEQRRLRREGGQDHAYARP